jgi:hypothetical protein
MSTQGVVCDFLFGPDDGEDHLEWSLVIDAADPSIISVAAGGRRGRTHENPLGWDTLVVGCLRGTAPPDIRRKILDAKNAHGTTVEEAMREFGLSASDLVVELQTSRPWSGPELRVFAKCAQCDWFSDSASDKGSVQRHQREIDKHVEETGHNLKAP